MEQENINIDLSQTEEIKCSSCGSETFVQIFFMRKVSAVIAGRDSLLPIPAFECARCGHVNEEFKPKED